MLVRYNERSKVYQCYEPSTKKILISKDLIFYEGAMGFSTLLAKQVANMANVIIPFSLILKEVP
jgi:hypothetical protein